MTKIETNRFILVTLNLRFGLADDGDNRWDLRKPVFPEMLRELAPDFLCVQEANDFQVADLSAMLKDYGYIGRRDPAPRFWQNNVIFHHNHWTCLENVHFFLSPTPAVPSRFRNSRWPRQCTLGVFQRQHQKLIVVDTHFDFDPEIQRKCARIILERLARQAPALPCVVAGDLNATPGAPCIEAFTRKSDGLAGGFADGLAGGFADGLAGGFADGLAGGFQSALSPPFTATAHGFTGATEGEPIDWILHRGGLVAETARVIVKPYGGRFPSDHFPILAHFGFD